MNRSALMVICISVLGAFGCAPAAEDTAPVSEPERPSADLRPFLEEYFSTWSSNDMAGYRSCFHDSAVVLFVSEGEVRSTLRLDAFIEQQASYLAQAEGPVRESMTSFSANEDSQGATVLVRWIFQGEGETVTGTDHFTLVRDSAEAWKIAALVWYQDRE